MIDSNFPLMVVCPECYAAIGAKCTERSEHIAWFYGEKFVDWFHFQRIYKAKAEHEMSNLGVRWNWQKVQPRKGQMIRLFHPMFPPGGIRLEFMDENWQPCESLQHLLTWELCA
jgi:hypothetical protein